MDQKKRGMLFMNQSRQPHSFNVQQVGTVVNRLFSARDTHVERVLSGISTYVYRIDSQGQTYYLRILPEAEASLAPEIAVLIKLRQHQISVPEVVHFEDYNETLGRPIMIEAEIKGRALSKSSLSAEYLARVALEAGRDLARLNKLEVDRFVWIKTDHPDSMRLTARCLTSLS